MNHRLSSIYSGPILSFGNPIFMRVVRHYKLYLYPCFSTQGIKIIGGILPSIA